MDRELAEASAAGGLRRGLIWGIPLPAVRPAYSRPASSLPELQRLIRMPPPPPPPPPSAPLPPPPPPPAPLPSLVVATTTITITYKQQVPHQQFVPGAERLAAVAEYARAEGNYKRDGNPCYQECRMPRNQQELNQLQQE
ncbi:hypothetical protein TKK_0014662 [Trichogramma kaykai]